MSRDVDTLTQAIELLAAGSWAVESALRCIATGDPARARHVLEEARTAMRSGLDGLRDVLAAAVQEEFDRPTRLARALASLQELQELQLEPLAVGAEPAG